MLEAMACGCLVIGSRTPPVEEVVRDGENGYLVGFFDRGAIASATLDAVRGGSAGPRLRTQARHDTAAYGRERALEKYFRLIDTGSLVGAGELGTAQQQSHTDLPPRTTVISVGASAARAFRSSGGS